MKVLAYVIITALLIPAGSVPAQTGGMKNADMKSAPAKKSPSTAYAASGIVKKVDAASGTVTLAHSPVKELNWPAMTMLFTVRDKALFGKLAVDRKVEFTFIQDGSDYVVTAVK
jgi:Cu(I)/Ag(I) efflux system periplasmic protein CusF